MGTETAIEWCDHTFNPVWGCVKISPACDNCYAAAFDNRLNGGHWGAHAPLKEFGDKHWAEPLTWNRAARRDGVRRRVFCASMADVFDNRWPEHIRPRLWDLIRATPHLDWLFLTKRPQNIAEMLPADWGRGWPNVWLGTTAENQEEADRRIPHLLRVPACVRFLSCEPLLGPVDLRQWLNDYGCGCGWGGAPLDYCTSCGWRGSASGVLGKACCPDCAATLSDYNACPECDGHDGDGMSFGPNSTWLSWIICGGESGHGARPMHPDWARALRDQCAAAGVPFLFKQWGEYAPATAAAIVTHGPVMNRTGDVRDWMHHACGFADGTKADVRAHTWTGHATNLMFRVGKKAAGRLLDGVQHDGYPEVRP